MTPTINGWVWAFDFYPCKNNCRALSNIFWYNSSNDLEFVKYTQSYHIILPEHMIKASLADIKFVHDNLHKIIESKDLIIKTNDRGDFFLNLPNNSRV